MGGRRVALLVATDSYQDSGLSRLAAPSGDIGQLAAVLGNPAIADFEVTQLYNRPNAEVGKAIGNFYRDRRRDDLILLYFTGHGIKDDYGQLYLAMIDTDRDNLHFTGIRGDQIRLAMEGCRSRQNVLVLDCCYAGAFPAGSGVKSDTAVHALEQLSGRGSVVLTSSDATQYSFEGNQLTKTGPTSIEPEPSSLFTRFLVEGLRTGQADLDGDGNITLDELYSYVHDHVTQEQPQQRPKKKEDVEGHITVAQNIHWTLPLHITTALSSPYAVAKLTALEELRSRYNGGNAIVQQRVLEAIRELTEDDSRQVSNAANQFLSAVIEERERARREAEEKARQEAEERARREAEEKARQEAEEKARQEAEERARREAEEKARQEAEEKARQEAEERARREAEEKARQEAEEKARQEAEEKARQEAEEKARQEAEERARREAEEKARREAEERARREAEERARREAEEKARHEAETVVGSGSARIGNGQSADGTPVKQPRRVSTRTRILGGAFTGIALIAVLIVVITSSNTPSRSAGAPNPTHSATFSFKADFSSTADGWTVVGSGASGQYRNGKYQINLKSSPAGQATLALASPLSVSGLNPAPPNISISASVPWVSDSLIDYGIACLSDTSGNNYYEFTMQHDVFSVSPTAGNTSVEIDKSTSSNALAQAVISANTNGTNELLAVCNTVSGGSAVHLEFWEGYRKLT